MAHSTSTNPAPAAKALFMPVRVAALVCCLAVTSLFAASGAIGWYYVWACQHIELYESEHTRAAIIAGVQGGLCTLIVVESVYGFIALLSNRKGPIRWYLWLSWITFFLGCIATTGTALLIWVFRFGVHDCTTNSSGQMTCEDLQLAPKIVLTIAIVLACWIQSYMPTVLRLLYSRFAVQEMVTDKLGSEPEVQPLQPVDEYLREVEAPETRTDAQADRLIHGSGTEV